MTTNVRMDLRMRLEMQEALVDERAQRVAALRSEAERLTRELDEWKRTAAYRRARRETEVV